MTHLLSVHCPAQCRPALTTLYLHNGYCPAHCRLEWLLCTYTMCIVLLIVGQHWLLCTYIMCIVLLIVDQQWLLCTYTMGIVLLNVGQHWLLCTYTMCIVLLIVGQQWLLCTYIMCIVLLIVGQHWLLCTYTMCIVLLIVGQQWLLCTYIMCIVLLIVGQQWLLCTYIMGIVLLIVGQLHHTVWPLQQYTRSVITPCQNAIYIPAISRALNTIIAILCSVHIAAWDFTTAPYVGHVFRPGIVSYPTIFAWIQLAEITTRWNDTATNKKQWAFCERRSVCSKCSENLLGGGGGADGEDKRRISTVTCVKLSTESRESTCMFRIMGCPLKENILLSVAVYIFCVSERNLYKTRILNWSHVPNSFFVK